MLNKLMPLGLLAAIAIGAGASDSLASVIASQGFDGTASDTWGYTPSTNASTGVNYAVSSTVPAWVTTTTTSGTLASPYGGASLAISGKSFQVVTNTTGTDQMATLAFDAVDVTGDTGVQVVVPVAGISTSSGNGMDNGDFVKVYVALNGAAFSSTPDLYLTGDSNDRWAFTATGSLSTTAGTPVSATKSTAVTNKPGKLIVNIPDGATSVALKIEADDNALFNASNNSSAEIWALDNIQLTGTVPEPASLSVIGIASGLVLGRRRRKI